MYLEEKGCIIQQVQDPIESATPNITYRTNDKYCRPIGDGGYMIWSGNNILGAIKVSFPDLFFEQSVTSCQNMRLDFSRETHFVNQNTINQKIDRVNNTVDLNNNQIELKGYLGSVLIVLGNRSMGFWRKMISSFATPFMIASVDKNNKNNFKDVSAIASSNINLFMPGFDPNKLRVVNFTTDSENPNSKFSFKAITQQDYESIFMYFYSPDAASLKIKISDIDFKVDDITAIYGRDAAIKVLGYSAVWLDYIYKHVSKLIHNESHAAIVALAILILMSQNIAYLLYILLALLKSLKKKDAKHINDNQDTLTVFLMSIIRNWKHIFSVYLIYAIYGVTSSKTIIEYLNINHGTWLNGGLTILGQDNSMLFLKTSLGYFTVMKVALLLALVSRQIIKVLTGEIVLDPNKHSIFLGLMCLVAYYIKYSYPFMLVLLVSNIMALLSDFISEYSPNGKKQ